MGVSVLVAAGWWVAIVALTPAADRPYVGGSQNNSILNLIFGYNGFGRITGNETGSVGGGRVAGSMWGPTGLTRLFNAEFGTRSRGCSPARWCSARRSSSSRCAPGAPTASGPLSCCGAAPS